LRRRIVSKIRLFEPVEAHDPKANANENGPSAKVRNWPARSSRPAAVSTT
jgi:hypothetical protein